MLKQSHQVKSKTKTGSNPRPLHGSGVGQLSLVEHALCPLESRSSLVRNLVHSTQYDYSDSGSQRQRANVRIFAPLGLSSSDEFYLWGLLALTMAHAQSPGHLLATPHWCLRQLGLIDSASRRGGRQYRQFADALQRLSVVSYLSDACYDPVRAEYRRVSFRFLSYSLPADPRSCRAWQFSWDTVFFGLVKTTGGSMRFDLTLYRSLDPASRRLFLIMLKVGYRRGHLPRMELRRLAVDLLGLSPGLALRDMKVKVLRTLKRLQEINVIERPQVVREAAGRFTVTLDRGSYLKSKSARVGSPIATEESPLIDGLLAIGFDATSAVQLVRRFPHHLVAQWTDITQAAQERFGTAFFRKSPMAYLVDSLSKAARGTRTPPDWWHELRRKEAAADVPTEEGQQLFARLIDEVFGNDQEGSIPEGSTPERSPSAKSRGLERAGDLLKTVF